MHEVNIHVFCVQITEQIYHTCVTNHRISEWFGLEGILKIIEFQAPSHK